MRITEKHQAFSDPLPNLCFSMVKQYIPYIIIGGRIYVERTQLEDLLADPERRELSLAS